MTASAFVPTAADDDALARRAAEGDRRALEALLERHTPTAARVAYLVLGNREDALDAAQEALAKAARTLNSAWSGQSFRAWLCVLARGCAVDLLRNRAALRKREAAKARETELAMPQSNLERAETLAALREELAALPDETAGALVLHHLEGLPVVEAAAQLAISTDACKQRLHRGRETLRERLERRGVRLASLALLLGLVEELCRSSQAWAAELPAATLQGMTQSAVLKAHSQAAQTGSAATANSDPSSADFENISEGTRLAKSRILQRNPHMLKAALIFVVTILLLGTGVLLLSSTFNDSPALQGPVLVNDAKPAHAMALKPAAEEPPSPPAWQSPRFFDGDLFPLAVSSRKRNAAVLILERAGEACNIFLLQSADGGQSWQRGEILYKGPFVHPHTLSSLGSLAHSEDGALVAALKINNEKGTRWIVSPRNKGAEEEVFQESEVFPRRVIRVPGGTWAFGLHTANLASSHGPWTVRASFGAGLTCPKEVGTIPGYGGEYGPSAWALDAQTAGVVVLQGPRADFPRAWRPEAPARSDGESLSLKHYFTGDGGKTWQSKNILFEFEEGSETVPSVALPYGLSRQGNRLGLLLHRGGGREARQWHLLLSENLGKDWALPRRPPGLGLFTQPTRRTST